MKLGWTYNKYKQRALILEGPFIICEVIATESFIESFLRTHTLEDIKSLGLKKVTPHDLKPFTLRHYERQTPLPSDQ